MENYKRNFMLKTIQAATDAGHIWPVMAAAEAALESGFGISELAIQDNNLFGMKQHVHPIFGTATLPTKEFNKVTHLWAQVEGVKWVKYPTLRDCFTDRMATLNRLKANYPNYASALTAPNALTYISFVSQTWSSDPKRAAKVQAIYQEYLHG